MFEELLRRISRELTRARIPYMVIGGQAVLLYGEPRLTRDVDVALAISPGEARRLIRILPRMGLEPLVPNPAAFLEDTFVLPSGDPRTPLRVDFIFALSEYERLAVERSRAVKVGRRMVRFISPEDLVIFKLVAGRPRDIEDVRGVVLKNPGLDSKYVLRWLAAFDRELDIHCREAFRRLRREAAPRRRPSP